MVNDEQLKVIQNTSLTIQDASLIIQNTSLIIQNTSPIIQNTTDRPTDRPTDPAKLTIQNSAAFAAEFIFLNFARKDDAKRRDNDATATETNRPCKKEQ